MEPSISDGPVVPTCKEHKDDDAEDGVGEAEDTLGDLPPGDSTLLPGTPNEMNKAVQILVALEDYCSGPDFTSAIFGFFGENGEAFDERTEDFPHEWYLLWTRYCALLESLLEGFDEFPKEEVEDMCVLFLARVEKEVEVVSNPLQDSNPLMCADYIQASLNYESFIQLAQEHAGVMTFSTAEAAAASPSGRNDDEEDNTAGSGPSGGLSRLLPSTEAEVRGEGVGSPAVVRLSPLPSADCSVGGADGGSPLPATHEDVVLDGGRAVATS